MTNPLVQQFEKAEIERLTANKEFPEFAAGDTLRLKLKIGERTAFYEGLCIGRRNRGLGSAFTVEKNSFGIAVRRVFPLYSPSILEVQVLKRGKVRRAKLNYLRARSSKESRLSEAKFGYKGKLVAKALKRKAKH